MDDVYEIIEEYNLNEELKLLIVFNFMIADMLSKQKLKQAKAEFLIRDLSWNLLNVYLMSLFTQYYFPLPKNIRLIEFYSLLFYENSRQARASANWNKSFIGYWHSKLSKSLQKMY